MGLLRIGLTLCLVGERKEKGKKVKGKNVEGYAMFGWREERERKEC